MSNDTYSPYKSMHVWLSVPKATGFSAFEYQIFSYYFCFRDRCTKSAKNVMEDLQMSKNTFYKHRSSLVEKGWLIAEQRFKENGEPITTEVTVNNKKVLELDKLYQRSYEKNGSDDDGYVQVEASNEGVLPKLDPTPKTWDEVHPNLGNHNNNSFNKLNRDIDAQSKSSSKKSKFDQPEFELLSLWLKVTSNRNLDYVGSQERKMAKHCQRLLDVMDGDVDLSIKLLKNQWVSKREAGLHYHTIKRFDDYVDFVIQERLHPAIDPPAPAPHYGNASRPKVSPHATLTMVPDENGLI